MYVTLCVCGGGGGGGAENGMEWKRDEERERRANKEGQTKMGEWGRGRGVEKEWAGERDRWGRKREMGEKEREAEERKIISHLPKPKTRNQMT